MARIQHCPRCREPIRGYVEECPSCGFEKPLPRPWQIYGIMALIFVAALWLLVDLEAVARAILSVREGIRAM